ncbi:MAG TPA: ATP-binding protein [Verrucomicrobiae bacterium]|nr:ATP-binding protein [Verrucomicrobiae bacterium]
MKESTTSRERAKTGPPEGAPEKNGGGPRETQPANILIVDDRADKLLAIEAVLSSLDTNIVKARSGKEALRCLLQREFACILLDVSMPCMDGFETAALIRKRASSEHTPILFITSINTSENHIAKGYELGAVDYMLTPIVPEVLRSKVAVFVELHQRSELIRKQAEEIRRIEKSRHERELADVEDRLETETKRNRFFTLSLDLLAIASFDDYFIQLNPMWESTLGFTVAELRSKSLIEFVHPEDRTRTAEQLMQIKMGAAAAYFENRYRCRDGSFRWLGWSAAPFPQEQLVYIFAHDITDRKASEAEIKNLNGELEKRIRELTEMNQELEAFGYSISHDLRAPLRSIRSFAQFLREHTSQTLDQEGHDYLRRVESAAKYMDLLLLDLLEYSRLNGTELELAAVDLDAACADVLNSIEKEVEDRQARVKVHSPLGVVWAHPATIRQVLYNLISNALKFVPPDQSPVVDLYSEQQHGLVRISVADHGIGIAPQYHQKIFGLFQRLHSNESYPGTGIGLALVRKGIERMGGRLGVESKPSHGTKFWFELKAAHSTTPARSLTPAN